MRLLTSSVHPELPDLNGNVLYRKATRAIVTRDTDILLLYTKRYDDFSLPGGGVDEGETLQQGLIRELQEETGAQNISNINAFGLYREYRPWYKPNHDIVHMDSYCFTCQIDATLGQSKLEDYEINNGMEVKWMNIDLAIKHNETTMAHSDKQGMSIIRETYLLKLIKQRMLNGELPTAN